MKWLSALGLAAGLSAAHAAAAGQTVIPVPYGITRLRLDDAGAKGVLVMAWRDNGNAHGFGMLTIYAEPQPAKSDTTIDTPALLLVPLFDPQKERLEVTLGGGADCQLHDFRLVREAGHPLQLIVADREYGTSYVDEQEVTFTTFGLHENKDRDIGRPDYYFEVAATAKAKRKYCDVNEAFQQELGLGPARKSAP